MGITKTILERMENNMLKWYGRAMQMADNTWLSEYWPGSGKEEKKRKTRNEIEKGCEQNGEAEESNTWRQICKYAEKRLRTRHRRNTGKLLDTELHYC